MKIELNAFGSDGSTTLVGSWDPDGKRLDGDGVPDVDLEEPDVALAAIHAKTIGSDAPSAGTYSEEDGGEFLAALLATHKGSRFRADIVS